MMERAIIVSYISNTGETQRHGTAFDFAPERTRVFYVKSNCAFTLKNLKVEVEKRTEDL